MSDTLLPSIRRLDYVLSGNAAGRELSWARRLVDALANVGEQLRQHEQELETPGGLFEMIDVNRPVWNERIRELCQEHAVLHEEAQILLHRLGKLSEGQFEAANVCEIRHETEDFCATLKHHWEQEADFVIDCVIRDIGGRFNHLCGAVTLHS